MSLHELIASDVTRVFINRDDFAEEISYRQGMLAAFPCAAIPHEEKYEVVDQEGFATTLISTDWDIPAVQLSVTPRAGDQIQRSVGGTTQVFEAVPVDAARPAASLDVSNSLWTVHSKRVR